MAARETGAVAAADRAIRLSGSDYVAYVGAWCSIRARQSGASLIAEIQSMEVSVLTDIDDWFDTRATGAEIRRGQHEIPPRILIGAAARRTLRKWTIGT